MSASEFGERRPASAAPHLNNRGDFVKSLLDGSVELSFLSVFLIHASLNRLAGLSSPRPDGQALTPLNTPWLITGTPHPEWVNYTDRTNRSACARSSAHTVVFGRRERQSWRTAPPPYSTRIAIADQEPSVLQQSVRLAGHLPQALDDEGCVRYGVEPNTCTRRDCNSITRAVSYVTSPRVVHTSVVKKSAAASARQCACTNVRHGGALPTRWNAVGAQDTCDGRTTNTVAQVLHAPEFAYSPRSDSLSRSEPPALEGDPAGQHGWDERHRRSICARPVHGASKSSLA